MEKMTSESQFLPDPRLRGDDKGQTKRPRILAIANQKGGVGKTTTAVNLATALAAVGQRVLLVDLDPQGNATTGLGIKRAGLAATTYDLLFAEAWVNEVAVGTVIPGLDILPSSVHLSGVDIELAAEDRREYRLKDAFEQALHYDYIICDCPPSLSLLTLNVFVAVDAVVVPLQCEFYALEGLSHLMKTIDRVRATYNPRLELHGILLTMVDPRSKLSNQVADDVRAHFGDKVYTTIIPRNVRLSEAPSHGLPAIVYDMRSPGSTAYINLAREIIKRERVIKEAA
jgi:chromosome partitioning protein